MTKRAAPPAEEPVEKELDPSAYNVSLPQFEGPLDLLLHLIQAHQLDILDIPMKLITEKYLAYINFMRTLTIDVASEYLLMAAVLTHIKSKMLLPVVPKDQSDDVAAEELDPREELVRRLLEYQKFKHAAVELQERGTLGQDVFTRPVVVTTEKPEDGPLAPLPVYSLFDAFSKLLERRKLTVDHEVTFDKLTITDRMNQITTLLAEKQRVPFEELFANVVTKFDLVITFLALLEMTKLKMTRLFQSEAYAGLYVEYAVTEGEPEGIDS